VPGDSIAQELTAINGNNNNNKKPAIGGIGSRGVSNDTWKVRRKERSATEDAAELLLGKVATADLATASFNTAITALDNCCRGVISHRAA
jgi:hypothetical protein